MTKQRTFLDIGKMHILRKTSYVDVHKTYRLPQSIVFKHQPIGMLSEYDVIALFDFVNNYFNKLNKK